MKILLILQIFRISYRSATVSLINHRDYLRMMGIKEISSFQTLSRRAGLFGMHEINSEISFLYSMESTAAMDSFMVHTC